MNVGEERANFLLSFTCNYVVLFRGGSSSSWCLGLVALFYCDTPCTFHITIWYKIDKKSKIFDENQNSKWNSPRWDVAFLSHLGLFCLSTCIVFHKKDAMLIASEAQIREANLRARSIVENR